MTIDREDRPASGHDRSRPEPVAQARQRVAIAGLITAPGQREDSEQSLAELQGLAEAAGGEVVLRFVQERAKPDPATFFGSGKVEMLAAASAEADAELIIFDNELSPAQLRNLERATERAVIDRTQLILDIFARRARTREGQLQVELAQLKYLMPRLVGASAALSRLGGGIGTRGPGETKLETDRRHIRHRISTIGKQITEVRRRRTHLRERRQEGFVPTVALVGYTNAGKTTLFNRLARQEAVASDALFVTLDPLIRQVRLAERQEILLSDTVGFINRLPHSLVAAFRATLEEVTEADLLLHVVDISNPEYDRHMDAVHRVLEEIEARDVPSLLVLNKCDRLSPEERQRFAVTHSTAVTVSAATGDGLARLGDAILRHLSLEMHRVTLEFDEADEADRQRIARLYRHARVRSHQAADGRVSIEADVPRRLLDRLTLAPAR